jgi:uncharacterized protein YbcV (DUF1398 family)
VRTDISQNIYLHKRKKNACAYGNYMVYGAGIKIIWKDEGMP